MTGRMMKSKIVFWLACAASLLIPLCAVAQGRPRIVAVTHGQASDSFWLVVRNGLEAATKETGSDLDYRAPEKFDMAAMSQMIDAAVASKPDGLIVTIPDVAALAKSIRGAVAAKIPVIAINSGWGSYKKLGCLMYIGQQEENAGKKAGERMKDMGVKKALILNQEMGNAALDERIKGFKNGFEGPFHHVSVLAVQIDFTQCQHAVAAYLRENDDIDGILALGPVAAEPALQAVDEVGKTGKIKLCTFDISPTIVQALVRKEVSFALDQQQWLQGYLPVVFLANYAKYGLLLQDDLVLTGPSFVTPENAGRVVDLLTLGFR
jgi:simple sugar transport system substrate-binding protein